MNPEIKEFAKTLIQKVRDTAIKNCDMQLKPNVNSPTAKRWRRVATDEKLKSFASELIPDCVDETIACLLLAIDQGILNLSFTAENGKTVDLTAEGFGELCGWYMGSGGWRAIHAKERYIDDFSDLK